MPDERTDITVRQNILVWEQCSQVERGIEALEDQKSRRGKGV